ncbi:MAG: IS110 family transposase [Ignavibacteria bacterium]|nr:IS110 family transposase [Ignavibacteria bacterium]
MYQLGIDISKAKFDVALLLANGKYATKVFVNTIDGFKQLLEWLSAYKNESIHVCMEGTGRLWEPLAEFLYSHEIRVSVANPAKVKGFAQSELRRSKSDKIDSKIIARFCRAQNPAVWVAPPPEIKAIRDRQRYLDVLKDHRVQELNRLQSGELDSVVRASILRHIEYLDSQIKTLGTELLKYIQTHPDVSEKFKLLTSIIGVGQNTAIAFLGEVSAARLFTKSREIEVFCGIAPRLYESGSSIKSRSRISKVGNSRIRRALYMPAVCAIRTNPVLREFALRLKLAGKPGKVIVCAVMRKLLRLMFTVLKSGKPYDVNFKSVKPSFNAAAVVV